MRVVRSQDRMIESEAGTEPFRGRSQDAARYWLSVCGYANFVRAERVS